MSGESAIRDALSGWLWGKQPTLVVRSRYQSMGTRWKLSGSSGKALQAFARDQCETQLFAGSQDAWNGLMPASSKDELRGLTGTVAPLGAADVDQGERCQVKGGKSRTDPCQKEEDVKLRVLRKCRNWSVAKASKQRNLVCQNAKVAMHSNGTWDCKWYKLSE